MHPHTHIHSHPHHTHMYHTHTTHTHHAPTPTHTHTHTHTTQKVSGNDSCGLMGLGQFRILQCLVQETDSKVCLSVLFQIQIAPDACLQPCSIDAKPSAAQHASPSTLTDACLTSCISAVYKGERSQHRQDKTSE